MNLTVYSMGDMPIFTSVLNAVAMVFNSSLFNPSLGAGVVVVGLLIGILFMILPVMGGAKINPVPFIFALLLFYAGVVPKERLQIEDVYSGQVSAVDNIPLIVALPASLAATLSKAISDSIETAFQTTSSSYLTMGAEGFVNPLKLLLGLRDPKQTVRTFPYLSKSITEFVTYCATTDSTFSQKTLQTSNDMIGYLTGSTLVPGSLQNVSGVMTYWNITFPNGYGVSCKDGQTLLQIDTDPNVMQNDINMLLKSSTAGEYAQSNNGATLGASLPGLNAAYNSVTAGIIGNMQQSQQFMTNMVAAMPTTQGVNCINQPMGPSMSDCMSNVMQGEAIEMQNIDSASAAGIFTRTMIPGMNILLALFYAFSPIVIAMAFMAGAHGIKMVLSFLMFGVWTQSWLPVAAVINYMIQMQTQYALSSFPASGVTMNNFMPFYNILSMKIGMASTMMAMTPMITMALLSGSMMALTSVADKMSAKDYTDEKKAAPSLGTNEAVTKNGGWVSAHTKPIELNSSSGAGTGWDIERSGESNAYGKADVSKSAGQSLDHKKAHAEGQSKQLDQALANSLKKGMSAQQQTAYAQEIADATSTTDSNQASAEKSWIHNFATTHGLDKSDTEALSMGVGLELAGNGAAAKKAFSMMKKEGIADQIQDAEGYKTLKSRGMTEDRRRSFAKKLQSSDASVLSNDDDNTVKEAISSSVKAEESYARAESIKTQVGTSNELDMQTVGALINKGMTDHGLPDDEALSLIDSKVTPENKAKFDEEEKRILALARRANGGNAPTKAGKTAAKLAALQKVDSDAFIGVLEQTGIVSSSQTPEGVNVDNLNQGVKHDASTIQSGRLSGVSKKTSAASKVIGSSGANKGLVNGFAVVADSQIYDAMNSREHLDKGAITHDRLQTEKESANRFLEEAQKHVYLDKNGHIESMANVAEAANQWADFEEAHPVAAAAVAMTPMGGVLKAVKVAELAGRGVEAAEAAAATATAAVRSAEAAERIAASGHGAKTAMQANHDLHAAQVAAEKAHAAIEAANQVKVAAKIELAAKQAKFAAEGAVNAAPTLTGQGSNK